MGRSVSDRPDRVNTELCWSVHTSFDTSLSRAPQGSVLPAHYMRRREPIPRHILLLALCSFLKNSLPLSNPKVNRQCCPLTNAKFCGNGGRLHEALAPNGTVLTFFKKERSTFETERWALIFEDVRTVPLRVTVLLINRESDSLLSAEKFYAIMKKSTNQVKSKQSGQNGFCGSCGLEIRRIL